ELAANRPVYALRQIYWLNPIIYTNYPIDVWIKLHNDDLNQQATFQIYTKSEDKVITHAEGQIDYKPPITASEKIDPGVIQSRCAYIGDKTTIYNYLKAKGFDYGVSFQVTKTMYGNEHEGFAHLNLSPINQEDFTEYTLH